MKAGAVHRGQEYAWVPDGWRRGRGRPFPMSARRVIVLSTRNYRPPYSDKARTYASCNVLTQDGEDVMRTGVEIPVGHLIDFWDSYEAERDNIRNASQRRELQERAEEKRRAGELTKLIDLFAHKTGFPRDKIGYFSGVIHIQKEAIEEWLAEDIQRESVTLDEIPLHVQHWLDESATPTQDATGAEVVDVSPMRDSM